MVQKMVVAWGLLSIPASLVLGAIIRIATPHGPTLEGMDGQMAVYRLDDGSLWRVDLLRKTMSPLPG
jgi:hypothetical protein